MTIVLYNTRTKEKEPLTPIDGKKVRLYTCGPTVYHYAHIGNLRTYVFEDVLKRAIIADGLPVLHVMNITDVGHLTSDADEGEDKMEKGARREGKSVWEIAQFYTDAFQQDIQRLNILEPDIWCKATDHIAEQIAQVQELERRGHTYIIEDGVYFDTSTFPRYADFAKLKIEDLKAGARVEVAEGKRNPTDFALWKFSPKDEQRAMEWDSPWGRGFPGWHIECSAMASKYLGEQFDIHCGGIDHIQVHHTNEIAQAEGATGKHPWVNIWMHGEFLVIDKGKMAKSGENFLTLQTLIDRGYDPLVYRYLCLTAHYRQQLSFSWESMESAKNSYEAIKTKVLDLKENPQEREENVARVSQLQMEFSEAVNDDLNMPKALAVLWDVLRDDTLASETRVELAEQFDAVLGLGVREFGAGEIPQEIRDLAEERERARKNKDFKTSDRLRDEITSKGYVLEDKKDGYVLRKA